MEGPGDLQRAVGFFSPDRSAKVKIWRDQAEKTFEVKVGQAPDERQAQQQQRPGGGRARSMLGLEVRPVTPEIARQLNLRTTDGVIVVRVEDGTAAAEAGGPRGDVVKPIKSAYRRLARKHHPDVAKGKDSADRLKEINEAYEVLSDPEKRRRYDSLGPDWQRYAQAPPGGPGGGGRVEYGGDIGDAGDFSEFFRSIFGDMTG